MPITLGSNIASLKAQRELEKSTSRMAGIYERLSSGQRINRASDDAAGLAIASSLSTKSRVYGQAVKNLNDGISYLSIADSTLSNLKDVVTRLQELATQAASGTLSGKQRAALNKEASELTKEYNRVIGTTSFNGRSIFDYTNGALVLQIGAQSTDVLSVEASGGTIIQAGNGSFTFSSTVATSITQPAFGITQPQVGDFNGDGHKDLFVFDSNITTHYSVFLNDGTGSFTAGASFTAPQQITARDAPVVGDLNGDGKDDVALIGFNGGGLTVSALLGNGDGTFSMSTTSTPAGVGSATKDPELADVNNDGILDLVAHGYAGGEGLNIFLGNGDGSFRTPITYSSPSSGIPAIIALADLNNDGNVDIIEHKELLEAVTYRIGNGDGTFNGPITIAQGIGAQTTIGTITDTNRDGLLDFVLLAGGAGQIVNYLNSSSGAFSQGASSSFTSGLGYYTADINGDQIKDIVASNAGGSLSTYLAQGDGTFGAGISSAPQFGPGIWGFTLADLNHDGAIDAIGHIESSTSVLIAKGQTSSNSVQARIFRLDPVNLTDREGAYDAITELSRAFSRIQAVSSSLGAYQSRIGVARAVNQTIREQYIAAQSRIEDTDIAAESAALVRTQILQQVGAAVLAQANLQPAIALRLLDIQ